MEEGGEGGTPEEVQPLPAVLPSCSPELSGSWGKLGAMLCTYFFLHPSELSASGYVELEGGRHLSILKYVKP